MKRTPMPRRRAPLRRASMPRQSWVRKRRRIQPAWWEVRKTVEARAGGRCEVGAPVCTGRGVHAHHVLMRSQGGDDSPDNLLWVCAPCHVHVHTHPAESYEQGWLRRRSA